MTNYMQRWYGNYRVISLLGKGGSARVYLGEHRYLRTLVAIKVLHTRLVGRNREGFLAEARTAARLGQAHPHIMRVLDFDVQADGTPFLVMDYAPHGSLNQYYDEGVSLPLPTVLAYVHQIAGALQYVHNQGVIHRDLKPGNMLLGPNNNVWLSDFGIAAVAQRVHSARRQRFVPGTVGYMAPEQLRGSPCIASDQYALAVVVYELLIGDYLFQGSRDEVIEQHLYARPPSLCRRRPDIPVAVERVLMKALAKNPQYRFASIVDFANALEQASKPSPRKRSFSSPPSRSHHREIDSYREGLPLRPMRRQQDHLERVLPNPVRTQVHRQSDALSRPLTIPRLRRRPTISRMPITNPPDVIESRENSPLGRMKPIRQMNNPGPTSKTDQARVNLLALLILLSLLLFGVLKVTLSRAGFASGPAWFMLGLGLSISSIVGAIQLKRFSPLLLLIPAIIFMLVSIKS